MEKYIAAGKLIKPHKLSGAFRFLLYNDLKNKKKVPGHFMLNIGGSYLPWFIKNMEWTGPDEGIILFEEISSPEKAKQYSLHELFLSENDLHLYFKQDIKSIDYLVNYKVLLNDTEELGFVQEILESPGQKLLSINQNGKEILIPFAEDFVVKINKKKEEIILNLPEGLIGLE